MIFLTRFHGDRFAVNPDLIQRVDATPDTIVTLIDGTKLLVTESLDEFADIVLTHRASIAARAIDLADQQPHDRLATVTGLATRGHLHVTPEAD